MLGIETHEPNRIQTMSSKTLRIDSVHKPNRIEPASFQYIHESDRTESSQGGYICSLPGSLEPGRLNLKPALSRNRAAVSAACPALSSQGGYICSQPGSFESGRLNLPCPALSSYIYSLCPVLSSQGGYICSLPGSFKPGRLYMQPARLFQVR